MDRENVTYHCAAMVVQYTRSFIKDFKQKMQLTEFPHDIPALTHNAVVVFSLRKITCLVGL